MSGPGHNTVAGDQLQSIVDRIERLEEEKAATAADIKEVYAEAKGNGFDTKTIRTVVKERKKDKAQRDEEQALLEIYMAALGMLDGTPLGDAARRRLEGEDASAANNAADQDADDAADDAGDDDDEGGGGQSAQFSRSEIEQARHAGQQAARDNARVIDNPFVAGDPRRAAWDEGWCAQTGSDGMEIPDAWRRKKPPAPAKDKAPAEGGAA